MLHRVVKIMKVFLVEEKKRGCRQQKKGEPGGAVHRQLMILSDG